MSKVYAVKSGRQTGIFDSWDRCQEQIKGFSGAEYKSFKSVADAQKYLNGTLEPKQKKEIDRPVSDDVANLYVDGSFKDGKVGFGVYIQTNNNDYNLLGFTDSSEGIQMRNILGELVGVIAGVQIARELGCKKLNIIYDYEGIENWYKGAWNTKNSITYNYANLLYKYNMENSVQYRFIKVESHTGNTGNEIADKLAKKAINNSYFADFEEILKGNYNISRSHFVEI
jgi:ribonuclease HI